VAPMGLGFLVTRLVRPDLSLPADLFVAATLAATSVGITARVYRDLGMLDRKESRIVLGAAVIDDVMGLVVLAVVQGMVVAAASGRALDGGAIAVVIVKALAFLAGAIVIGWRVAPYLFRAASFLRVHGMLLVTALAVCFLFSWTADRVGLAAIVGAFAAGLVLDEVHYRGRFGEAKLEEHIRPLTTVLVPLFFVRMGIAVDLRVFARTDVLIFAGLLTAAAVIGKQVCGLGVIGRGMDRLSVGLGMIPRGEVGLIVADAGRKLALGGTPVVDDATYSAVVIVVMLTTLATPPVLGWSLRRRPA
jgi:Na+:H+ antiporter